MDGITKKQIILDSNIIFYYYKLGIQLPRKGFFFSGLLNELKTIPLEYIQQLNIIDYKNKSIKNLSVSKPDNIFLNYIEDTNLTITIVTNDKKLKRALKTIKNKTVYVVSINSYKMLSPGFEPELQD